MGVKDYYYEHFYELSPEKRFHFAVRMKNFFKTSDFDDYLMNNRPSKDLKSVLSTDNSSKVANYAARKPYFEKYAGIYGVDAALFRVYHLLRQYGEDIRSDLLELYPKEKLYDLVDRLLKDEGALKTLSTWAINVIYLTEELFPRESDTMERLFSFANDLNDDSLDAATEVYFYTHLILCESDYYKKDLRESERFNQIKALLTKCEKALRDNIDSISLDAAVEFLVCAKMAGVEFTETKDRISELCNECFKRHPYVVNYRRSQDPGSRFYTLDGAEHINALYIMSGLEG